MALIVCQMWKTHSIHMKSNSTWMERNRFAKKRTEARKFKWNRSNLAMTCMATGENIHWRVYNLVSQSVSHTNRRTIPNDGLTDGQTDGRMDRPTLPVWEFIDFYSLFLFRCDEGHFITMMMRIINNIFILMIGNIWNTNEGNAVGLVMMPASAEDVAMWYSTSQ